MPSYFIVAVSGVGRICCGKLSREVFETEKAFYKYALRKREIV